MSDDRDIWAAALLLVKRYGDDAMLEAAQRADQVLDEGRRLYVLRICYRRVGGSSKSIDEVLNRVTNRIQNLGDRLDARPAWLSSRADTFALVEGQWGQGGLSSPDLRH